jgi:Bax protein
LPAFQVGFYSSLLASLAAGMFFLGSPTQRQVVVDSSPLKSIVPIAAEAGHATTELLTVLADRHVPFLHVERPEPVPVRHHSVAALEEHWERVGFDLAEIRSGEVEVARVFVTSIPHDVTAIDEPARRKRTFIAMVLPHILHNNDQITADRERLLRLGERIGDGLKLRAADEEWLAQLAQRYGLDEIDLAELKRRVDIVPVSLALAQAAEESGWGTSRFALGGNAVFGQYASAGAEREMVPAGRADGANFTIRAFQGLDEAVAHYMLNLNTHNAYAEFRRKRDRLRVEGKAVGGRALAETLTRYSVQGIDYVRTLNTIMRVNRFDRFEGVRLSSDVVENARQQLADAR